MTETSQKTEDKVRNNDKPPTKFKGRMTPKKLQKSQLEKLMAEPDKPVDIPAATPEWKPQEPPEFKRFYMGSSAGAGSEVFHVYRHLRRYEMTRQQWIQEKAEKEDKDAEFQQRLAEKKAAAEEKTAKKRAKRLKKKQRLKEKLSKDVTSTETTGKSETCVEEEDSDIEKDDDAFTNAFVIGGR